MPDLLRALRSRNYRLFFGGQSVSLIGTWITRISRIVFGFSHVLWLSLVVLLFVGAGTMNRDGVDEHDSSNNRRREAARTRDGFLYDGVSRRMIAGPRL